MSEPSSNTPSIGGPYAALRVVRECSTAQGAARSVLTALATYTDATGLGWPSVAQLARDSGRSRSTVQAALRQLEVELCEIRVDRGTGRGNANEYRIRLADLIERHAQAVDNPVIPGIDAHIKGPAVRPFPKLKGPESRSKGPGHRAPSAIEQPIGEDARADPRRCARHQTVENPPPCIPCRDARLAADAADEQATKDDKLARAQAVKDAQVARRDAPKPPPASPDVIEAARRAVRNAR